MEVYLWEDIRVPCILLAFYVGLHCVGCICIMNIDRCMGAQVFCDGYVMEMKMHVMRLIPSSC